MKKVFATLVLVFGVLFAVNASAGFLNIEVTPGGDGMAGKDRWGYSAWDDSGFENGFLELGAYHWYEYGDGSWRNAYLQYDLGEFTGIVDDIVSVTFNYNLLSTATREWNYYDVAGMLYHAEDSSSATGNASDMISGNQWLETIMVGATLGWHSLDVTDYIVNDLTMGYAWSAFEFKEQGYAEMYLAAGESETPSYLRFETVASSSVVPVTTPEPSTFALLSVGILGVVYLHRRKRRLD